MDIEKRVELIDKVLPKLYKNGAGTVPESLHGFQRFPQSNSAELYQSKFIEQELLQLKLAEKIDGGDNSYAHGFLILKLSYLGANLVMDSKSVLEFYAIEKKGKNIGFDFNTQEKFTESELTDINKKIDEILYKLKEMGLGHEILYNEIQDLKNQTSQDKKTFSQIVKGKFWDVVTDESVDQVKEVLNENGYGLSEIFTYITGETTKFFAN